MLRGGKESTEQASALKTHIAGLLEQEDKIDAEIDRKRPVSGSIGTQSLSPSVSQDLIAEMQKQLDPTTALLEYWTGGDSSYLWVVTSTSVHSYLLPPHRTMNALTSRLIAKSQAPFTHTSGSIEMFAARLADSQARFDAAALRLGTVLLPARALPRNVHTLLIVGDGPLLSVPFEALRIAPEHGQGSVYVQERYSLVREPSIGVLLELLQEPIQRQSMKVAVIADPVFSANDSRLTHSAGSDDAVPSARIKVHLARLSADEIQDGIDQIGVTSYLHPQRLAFAGQEAREIASLAGPERSYIASGLSANPQRVRSLDWEDYTIAHFATHAFLNPSHPELDSVVLSTVDASGHAQSGVLWFSDICDLRMPVQLVVLSTCQSGNGRLMPGEGLVGIAYAFFVAGAHRVAGALWDIDDQATEMLMRDFYAALLDDSLSPTEALRSAQLKMSKRPRWKHPYYWAGFTIEGDWRNVAQ
jgi:CHAT domain-containing protein